MHRCRDLVQPALFRRTAQLAVPLIAVCAALLLQACAQLPDLGQAPQLKPVDAFQTSASLQAPAADWPTDQWWTRYADPQLNALIDEALASAPDLLAAQARRQRAEAVAQITGSALKPQLGANAAISQDKLSDNYLTPAGMTPQDWNDYGRVTLDFRWELDFWGKNRAALAAATSELEADRAELAQTRLLLAASIAAHYAELSRLYANRATTVQSVAIRQQTAALFARRFDNCLETRGSVREADARRTATEGGLLAIDEQIALQRNRLAALLGAGPDRGLSIAAPSLTLDHSFGLPAQLSVNLLGRRPDVVAARLQAEAQGRRIEQKKAEF